MALYPGKGLFMVLNEEYANFIDLCLADVASVYSDDLHDIDPKAVITLLTDNDKRAEGDFGALNLKWTYAKDDFGTKAWTGTPYKSGELRVTVVLTKQNELKLDIREWYEKD